MYISPSSFILRKPFLSIAINKKVKFDGARSPTFCVSKVITSAHAHKSGVIFHIFPRAFKQKKITALRPKMAKIASRGSYLKMFQLFGLHLFFCVCMHFFLQVTLPSAAGFRFDNITKNAPYAWGNFHACAITRF